MRQQILTSRAAALFSSDLPAGHELSPREVRLAVATTVRECGTSGCVARMAAAYGDCPETAAPRMRWALQAVAFAYAHRPDDADRHLILAA